MEQMCEVWVSNAWNGVENKQISDRSNESTDQKWKIAQIPFWMAKLMGNASDAKQPLPATAICRYVRNASANRALQFQWQYKIGKHAN